MKNNGQAQFIENIRLALGKPSNGESTPHLFNIQPDDLDSCMATYNHRSQNELDLLKKELKVRTESVQISLKILKNTLTAAEYIHKLATHKTPEWDDHKQIVAWDHPLIKELNLENNLSEDGIDVIFTDKDNDSPNYRNQIRKDIEASFIGITSADFVVAHTATMVMKSRPGQLRSVSLVPSIHICVIRENQILSDLEELYIRLQWEPGHKEEGLTNCMTFISAPSKTGDIELVMVNGAHGPREVHLIIIEE